MGFYIRMHDYNSLNLINITQNLLHGDQEAPFGFMSLIASVGKAYLTFSNTHSGLKRAAKFTGALLEKQD